MKKVLKNVEIAAKVVEELEKKGYEVSYEKSIRFS
jgi:G:T-mismatch repair DNA endonuclease (very short patch repair protein)